MHQIEIEFIKQQLIDTSIVSIKMTEITSIVCDMMQDNLSYTKKNGLTKQAKESRDRLLKLLNLTELFNNLSVTNNSLQVFNRQLFNENLKLKGQLAEIKRQENIANSI